MTRQEIHDKILNVLEKEIILRPILNVNENEKLGEEGIGIDSLNFLKFLTALEKDFGIKIEDDYWDYKQFNTLNMIIDYFSSKTSGI